jgi:hypothetical protein
MIGGDIKFFESAVLAFLWRLVKTMKQVRIAYKNS